MIYKQMQLIKLLGGSYVKIPKRPGEPEKTHANISKISKMLKWSPKINFSQGIKLLIEYEKDNNKIEIN